MSGYCEWMPFYAPDNHGIHYLKYILSEVYELTSSGTIFNENDLAYLRGIRDGSAVPGVKKEATMLIEAIEKHEKILVRLIYD